MALSEAASCSVSGLGGRFVGWSAVVRVGAPTTVRFLCTKRNCSERIAGNRSWKLRQPEHSKPARSGRLLSSSPGVIELESERESADGELGDFNNRSSSPGLQELESPSAPPLVTPRSYHEDDGSVDISDEVEDDEFSASESKRARRARLEMEILERGTSPIDILMGSEKWNTGLFWTIVNILSVNERVPEVLLIFDWWKRQKEYTPRELHYIRFIRICGFAHMPDKAQTLFDEMVSLGIPPTVGTYTCLLQAYAEVGLFDTAREILGSMIQAGLKPNGVTYTGLLHAYGKHGHYDEMAKIFNAMKTYEPSQPECAPTDTTYSVIVQGYAKGGLLTRMEKAFKEMITKELTPDSLCINALVQAYAEAGLLKEMERSYGLIKEYKFGAKLETVRAVASAYVRKSYFYQLGTFARFVKRKRVGMGNLIENLLLLSHAANFSMRGLAKEYITLKESGFHGDLMTFNLRALAFSKMHMFWDLRVTVLEMQHQGVLPDLVTYGAVVDAYVSGDLHHKIPEALSELRNVDDQAEVRTDTLVFEAFGRGDFQLCCEELASEVDDADRKYLTYANLVGYYLKKLEIKSAAADRN